MINSDIQKYILDIVRIGNDIMISGARRSGKTHTIGLMLDGPLADKNVLVMSFRKVMAEEIKRRVIPNKRHRYESYQSFDRLRGINFDVVILDECSFYQEDTFRELLNDLVCRDAQIIFVFSPIKYDISDPPILKTLWDQSAANKFQLGLPYNYDKLLKDKQYFPIDMWQTEICGNWVGI